jgi:hypothetical protein
MVSYRSLRHIGLMTVVAAAAIMAAGVAWAATLTCIPTAGSFNTANCPTGSCHLAEGVVNCVFDTTAQTVTCSEPCDITVGSTSDICYVLGGVGNTNANAHLDVTFTSTSTDASLRSRNGQLNVTQLEGGLPATGPTIASFTYTLTFAGKDNAFITITDKTCSSP